MKARVFVVTALGLAICGAVGWYAGRGARAIWAQRPSPLAAIQPVTSVSDDEARTRVLQLIQAEAIDQGPTVECAFTFTSAECAEPPLALPHMDRFDLWLWLLVPSPLIIEPEEDEELKDFFKVTTEKSDSLAMRIPPPRPEAKRARPTLKINTLPVAEDCPPHPEVDTLDYRPSDAKKGEAEKFQRKIW